MKTRTDLGRGTSTPELGLWEWDLEKQTIWLDERFLEGMGWDPALNPLDRSRWEARLHPDDRALASPAPDERHDRFRGLYRVRSGDGQWRWLLSSGGVVERSGDGHAARASGFYVDVTELGADRAELARRLDISQACNRMAELILANDDPSLILENMATIAGETLGLDRALIYDIDLEADQATALCEWLSEPSPEVAPTRGVYPLALFRTAALEIGRTRSWLESHADRVNPHLAQDAADRLLHGDMNIASLLWYPFGFHDRGFHVLVFNQVHELRRWRSEELDFVRVIAGYVSLALMKIDITSERRRASFALLATEERYRTLYDQTPSMFLTLDTNGVVLAANRFALETLGLSELDLVGRDFVELLHPEDRETAARKLEECALRSSREPRCEVRMLGGGGRTLWVEQAARVVRAPDGSRIMLLVGSDISERRQTEEAVLQAQKLESLGVLAGGIAHDFNNLLVGILGTAKLLEGDLPEGSPFLPHVAQIATAGRRASDLANQLLAYAGKGQLRVEPIELGETIREMAELLGVSAGRQTRIALELASEPIVVEADVTQLRQVLMNLVVNASEAVGDRGGTVRIESAGLWLSEAEARARFPGWTAPVGDCVRIAVSDDGAGISAAVLPRLFDPFFSTKAAGRGLGLAAVQGIVRTHRGAIRVRSEQGVGTTFELVLPRSRQPADVRASARGGQATAPLAPCKVLIVDDDPTVLSVTSAMVARAGHTVVAADSGAAARAELERDDGEIACLLLDLTMPQGGGAAVLEDLRRLRPDLPVVLMSGYSEVEATAALGRQGIQAFLRKPFTPAELARSLDLARRAGG